MGSETNAKAEVAITTGIITEYTAELEREVRTGMNAKMNARVNAERNMRGKKWGFTRLESTSCLTHCRTIQ